VIDATAGAPDAPTDVPRVSRVRRILLIVMSAQLALIALGLLLFSSMGFAEVTGSCGGG
jgi:hypothetical protein